MPTYRRFAFYGLLWTATLLAASASFASEFSGRVKDGVLHIRVDEVGEGLISINLSDEADTRMYLSIDGAFAASQRINYSVQGEMSLRVSAWGESEPLPLVEAIDVEEPMGKGKRLTYADGTVLVVVH